MQTNLHHLQGSLSLRPRPLGRVRTAAGYSLRPRNVGTRPIRLLRARAESGDSPAADEDSQRRRDAAKSSGVDGIGDIGGGGSPLLSGLQVAGGGIIQKIWGDRPPTDGPLNYAQMLEYLANKRVLRLMIYDEGKNAIGAQGRYTPTLFIHPTQSQSVWSDGTCNAVRNFVFATTFKEQYSEPAASRLSMALLTGACSVLSPRACNRASSAFAALPACRT